MNKIQRRRPCCTEENTSKASRSASKMETYAINGKYYTKVLPVFFSFLFAPTPAILWQTEHTKKRNSKEKKKNQSFSPLHRNEMKKKESPKSTGIKYVYYSIRSDIERQANRYISKCMRPRAVAFVYCV